MLPPIAIVSLRSLAALAVFGRGPAEIPQGPAPLAEIACSMHGELGEVVREMSDALWVVFQDSAQRRWFGSDGQGVYRVDGERIVRFTTKDGLAHDQIRQILEDGAGNLYFNTLGGISKFDGQRFTTLVPVESGASASGWKAEPSDLWFLGRQEDKGPYRYDGSALHRLEFPKSDLEELFTSKFPRVPYSPYGVYTTFRDKSGALWFGTAVLGVCRFDGSSFTWIGEDDLTEIHDGPSFGVRGILEDKHGKFWLSNLLHRYEIHVGEDTGGCRAATTYRKAPGIVAGEDRGNANFMSGLTDREGISWVATLRAGVWRYDGEQLTHVPVPAAGPTIDLFSIYEDRDGVLWLGTQANGSWRFDGASFERFRP